MPGLVYIGVTLLVAVGAFNSQNNLLFLAFGLALAVFMVSGVISGAMLMGIELERVPGVDLSADAPAVLRYRVRNRNRLVPCFAIMIEERSIRPLQPGVLSLIIQTISRGTGWLAVWMQGQGWRPARIHRGPALSPPEAFVEHVAARSECFAEAHARTLRRGVVQLGVVRVWSGFPFGLIRKSVDFWLPAELVIRPAVTRIGELPISPAGAGDSAAARSAGQGEEFYALRDYVPGDPLKSIAWRPSARRDKLQVKQTAAATAARLWLDLELTTGPEHSQEDERTISLAAGAATRAYEQGLAFGISESRTGLCIPIGRGPAHLSQALDELGRLDLDVADAQEKDTQAPPTSDRSESPGITTLRVPSDLGLNVIDPQSAEAPQQSAGPASPPEGVQA